MSENSKDKNFQGQTGVEHYQPSAKALSDNLIEVEEDFSAPKELLKAQSLANLLDTAVKIPFIGIKVGLDSLIGLIPALGDTIMLLASLRIVHLARKMNVPKGLQIIMLRTILIDYVIGLIPLVGDLLDVFYKANLKNVRTMEKWWVGENKDKIDALAKKQVAQWNEQNNHDSALDDKG